MHAFICFETSFLRIEIFEKVLLEDKANQLSSSYFKRDELNSLITQFNFALARIRQARYTVKQSTSAAEKLFLFFLIGNKKNRLAQSTGRSVISNSMYM